MKLGLLRNHGLESRDKIVLWGHNSRLDSIQAAILNIRLKELPKIIEQRRQFAKIYCEKLKPWVLCPKDMSDCYDTYHLFVIQTPQREALKEYLKTNEIETSIHYPVPIHLQPCATHLGYKTGDFPNIEQQSQQILSMPMHNGLSTEEVVWVANTIIEFFS
jgi:dTDP-4-amino-4,6-dideoxygalactose transaminase